MLKSVSIALAGAAAISLMLGSCTKSSQSIGAQDPENVKQLIEADQAKWNQQFKARDSEGLVSHYAHDAYFVAPGVTASGSTEIRKAYADASTDPAFAVSFKSDKIDVAASGDLAYARGKFTAKYTNSRTNKVMTDSGSYITVYKKQDDGSWKAVEDIAAADPGSVKEVPPEKPATRARMVSFGGNY